MCFCDNLKKCRETKGMSQKELAEIIGVAPSTYSLYESGAREPDVLKIKSIAKALDVTGDYLLFGTDKPFFDDIILTEAEKEIIKDFRSLSEQGKEYMLQTINICKSHFMEVESEKYTDDVNLSIAEQFQKAKPNKVAAYGKNTSSNIK